MKFIKINLKAFLFSMLFLLISTFFITIFNYINILNIKLVNIFTYIIPFLSFLLGGIIIGKNSNKKIILEGFKFSLISLVIISLFNYLLFHKFNFILSLIILLSSILGSIIGFKKTVN